MATFTIGQAARETGLSKSSISRAIKRGKLSAIRNEDKTYSIDASELFRVYPAKCATGDTEATDNGNPHLMQYATLKNGHIATGETHNNLKTEAAILAVKLEEREREVSDLKAERERFLEREKELKADQENWRKQAETNAELARDSQKLLEYSSTSKARSLFGWFSKQG